MTGQEKGELLIQVTAYAGLTVCMFRILPLSALFKLDFGTDLTVCDMSDLTV